MRPSTAQNLASLFRTAVGLTSRRSTGTAPTSFAADAAKKKKRSYSSGATAKKKPTSSSSSADDAYLKEYVSSINSSSTSSETAIRLLKQYKAPSPPTISNPTNTSSNPTNTSLQAIVSDRSSSAGCRDDDDKSAEQLSNDASSILHDEMGLDWDDEYEGQQNIGNVLCLPWLTDMTNTSLSVRRKEGSRVKKQKWVFKCTQTSRYGGLVNTCGQKLGSDTTIEIFGKLGKETGLNEYNALIRICIEKARDTTDEDVSVEQICKAYQLLKLVRERGFEIKEETYGQFLMLLIDSGMVEEFFLLHELIRDESPDSLPRLAYYKMLLWVRVNNEEKIQELCRSAVANDAEEKSYFRECLLMALCESDRREDFLMLLETLDITKVSPVASIERVFRSLGKLVLEPYAERFLLALQRSDIGAENISTFIREYAISIPNLAVEDIIVKFQKLHTKFEVLPTSAQYEKLITYCCELFKVHEALDVVDEAFGSGIGLSLETFHSILDACYRSCEFNLVHQINSRISHHNLKPNDETISKMILLYVKMKDFEGAYGLINDLPNMDVKPTASIYKTIICTVDLLKQLKDKYMNADVALEVLFDEAICLFAEKGSTDMEFGLNLLQAIKEELGIDPSRKSLDFLLAACDNAKDSKSFSVVWKEYEAAGLPCNVLSFVRMYQALLASGKPSSVRKKRKKKNKALVATLGLIDVLEAKTK